MQIQIVGTELPGRACGPSDNFPGYPNIHVGVQFKSPRTELLDRRPADATSATWTLDCSMNGTDIRGPQIQGRPGDRFVYLSWGNVDDEGGFTMFRRAKLMLTEVPADILSAATASGMLVGSLSLTDSKGQPLCARVVPPKIRWTAR